MAERKFSVDKWVEETISGTKKIGERKLGRLLKRMRNGDVLTVSEISASEEALCRQ